MIFLHPKKLLYNLYFRIFRPKLINQNFARTILSTYGGDFGHGTNFTRGDLGLGLVHYSMVKSLRPERILCVGSEYGFVPAMLSLACKDSQFGHVDFVDAGKNTSDKNSWGGVGFWKPSTARNHFKLINVDKYITCHIMDSQKYKKKFPHQKYDYIYIDGDHSYTGVKSDYLRFWPQLVVTGFMSFHDIFIQGLSRGEEFGVWKLWQELKQPSKFFLKTTDNAIGFIQKTK